MGKAVAQPPQAARHFVSGEKPDQQCNPPHGGNERNKYDAAFPFVVPDNFLVAFVGGVLEHGHPVEPRMHGLLCPVRAGFADGVEVLFPFFLARFVVTVLHIVCVACGGIEQGNGRFLQFAELCGGIGAAVHIRVNQFGFAAIGAADIIGTGIGLQGKDFIAVGWELLHRTKLAQKQTGRMFKIRPVHADFILSYYDNAPR